MNQPFVTAVRDHYVHSDSMKDAFVALANITQLTVSQVKDIWKKYRQEHAKVLASHRAALWKLDDYREDSRWANINSGQTPFYHKLDVAADLLRHPYPESQNTDVTKEVDAEPNHVDTEPNHVDDEPCHTDRRQHNSVKSSSKDRERFRTVVSNYKRISNHLREYAFYNVSWEDCDRSAHSMVGNNISDWTLETAHGICPMIRHHNFTDRTLTMYARDVAIVVNGGQKVVHFQHFLENFGSYAGAGAGIPSDVNLSLSPNDVVTVRFVAVIVPEGADGCCEVVPTCYNYQTCDNRDPKNFIGVAFHKGVGIRVDGTHRERVYSVRQDEQTGQTEDTWLKIGRADSTESSGSNDGSVLGTRSTGVGKNRVMCFQIPRQQDMIDDDIRIISRGRQSNMVEAVVEHGTSVGEHSVQRLRTYKREPGSVPTLTFTHYFTTRDGNITTSVADTIISTLENDYADHKRLWVGSLVTGKSDEKTNPTNLTTFPK